MNKVTVAKSAGFCFGVDRAVKMVYNELESYYSQSGRCERYEREGRKGGGDR